MAPTGCVAACFFLNQVQKWGGGPSIGLQVFHAHDLTRSREILTHKTVRAQLPSRGNPVEICPRQTRRYTATFPEGLRTIAPRSPTTTSGFRKRSVEGRRRGPDPSRPFRAFRYQTMIGQGPGDGATGRKRREASRWSSGAGKATGRFITSRRNVSGPSQI